MSTGGSPSDSGPRPRVGHRTWTRSASGPGRWGTRPGPIWPRRPPCSSRSSPGPGPGGGCEEDEFDVEQLEPLLAALQVGRAALGQQLAAAEVQARAARLAAQSHLAALAQFDRWTANVAARRRFPVEEVADAGRKQGLDRARTLLDLGPSLLRPGRGQEQLAVTAPVHQARLAELGSHGRDGLGRRACSPMP